jgi:hypothetical protein
MMTTTRMTPSTARTADSTDAGPVRTPDGAGAARGACRILLVADRVPSLRAGSTHKVYRGWRFAAVTQRGQPQPGTTVFTVPVDPTLLATSGTRYALAQLGNQGSVAVGETAAFSWAPTSIGTADPFAAAQARARRVAEDAGWTPDAEAPTRYAKTDPSAPLGEAAAPPPAAVAHPPVPGGAIAPGVFAPAHLPAAVPPPDITGLDAWEMDGGACATGGGCRPDPDPERDR